MSIRIDGTNTTANPGITGGDADTGLQFGTDEIQFVTGGTEQAKVDSSGRLLVGASSASTCTAAFVGRSDSTTESPFIRLDRNLATPADGNALGTIAFGTTSDSNFKAGAKIDVFRDGGTWTANSSMPSRLVFSTTADGASSPTERMRIASNGAFNCYTDSNDGFSVRTSAGAGTGAYIYQGFRSASSTTSGTVVYRVYSNGTYATISDATQKKNIETTRDGYLEDLNALRVVKYHWNEQDDSEQKELGLIAQEVETVFPGLVDQFDSGEGEPVKGIKNSVLTFMLIKALQEASAKIETLEAKVAALEANP